jgi:reticulon-4-interacting protein 1, mitochondrial
MKAWTFSQRGQPLNVVQLTNIPTPEESSLRSDELLVKVSHSSLNLISSILAWVVPMFIRTNPSIPEVDFSGRVIAKGKDVPSFAVGDNVFGTIFPGRHIRQAKGTLAEYVIAQRDEIVKKPDNVSFEEAAGLATVGVTAYFLLSKSGLKTGDSVLINGGSGGTGLAIIQAARDIVGPSGRIVTTCSGRNTDLVKSFGADEVVDYTKHPSLPAHLKSKYGSKPFDAILDTVGTSQALYNGSPGYLAANKPYLAIGSPLGDGISIYNVARNLGMQFQNNAWPTFLGGTPRPYQFVDSSGAGTEFKKMLAAAMAEGKQKGKIDGVYAMEDVKKVGPTSRPIMYRS